jgi:hypothetical protein
MAKRQFVRVVFEGDSVSAPPSQYEIFPDRVFRGTTWLCTLGIILFLLFILRHKILAAKIHREGRGRPLAEFSSSQRTASHSG